MYPNDISTPISRLFLDDNHRQRPDDVQHSYSHNQHQNEVRAPFFDVHYIVEGFLQVIPGADPEIIAKGSLQPIPHSIGIVNIVQAYVISADLTTQIIHTLCCFKIYEYHRSLKNFTKVEAAADIKGVETRSGKLCKGTLNTLRSEQRQAVARADTQLAGELVANNNTRPALLYAQIVFTLKQRLIHINKLKVRLRLNAAHLHHFVGPAPVCQQRLAFHERGVQADFRNVSQQLAGAVTGREKSLRGSLNPDIRVVTEQQSLNQVEKSR